VSSIASASTRQLKSTQLSSLLKYKRGSSSVALSGGGVGLTARRMGIAAYWVEVIAQGSRFDKVGEWLNRTKTHQIGKQKGGHRRYPPFCGSCQFTQAAVRSEKLRLAVSAYFLMIGR
jgi:hypothetical protein